MVPSDLLAKRVTEATFILIVAAAALLAWLRVAGHT